MNEIKHNGKTVAIIHKRSDWKEGLDFLTPNAAFIQAGTWWYQKGKSLRAHVHIENERCVTLTQETVIVLNGRLRIDFYSPDKQVFQQEELGPGDAGIILEVGHGYEILEADTKVIEVKNGPFISVEKDKQLI